MRAAGTKLLLLGSGGKASRVVAAAGLLLVLLGCHSGKHKSAPEPAKIENLPADEQFEKLAHDFVKGYYDFRPLAGVSLGWHEYDGKFVVPTRDALVAEERRLEKAGVEFRKLAREKLRPENRHDLRLLASLVSQELWSLEAQRNYWHNPMTYATALDTTVYIKRDFKPLAERVGDIATLLLQAKPLFAAAHANLDTVLPKPLIETAIEGAKGTADFIEHEVTQTVATLSDTKVQEQFLAAMRPAVVEIRAYAEWLKAVKLPQADQSFPVGRAAFVQMLAAEYINLTPEQILAAGLRELVEEQQRFSQAAHEIDPNKSPSEVFQSLQREHPTAEGLIPDARRSLENIRKFVVDHRILTIPSSVRARVEETPPPLRATSFASMDTPGPFELKATEAYYYITPVESDWTPKQAEEWLSAFSYYDLDVTSIHEAYPGHYVQFLALNASHATEVEKIVASYPFVEGWAHYTEQMMLAEGFMQPAKPAKAKPEEVIRAAKYRLAQSDEALLRICRLCCSIKMHCQGLSVDEATRFFMDNCYFEEKPARSEAMRGTYDPGYLYYTLGKLMILKLRHDWQMQQGKGFSLEKFHNEFLRHGAPPMRLLRELMLEDSTKWPELL